MATTLYDAPEWLYLLPAGEIRTADGRGPYSIGDPQALIARSMAAGKLALDVNHAMTLAAPKGQPSPACGWIVELQSRHDGIWGRVEWVDCPTIVPVWKAYQAVSPVIGHNKSGNVVLIKRASLVNATNVAGFTTLHSTSPVLGASLPLSRTPLHHASSPTAGGNLTAADEEMIRLLGLDRDTYATQLNAERTGQAVRASNVDTGVNHGDLAFAERYAFDPVTFAADRQAGKRR